MLIPNEMAFCHTRPTTLTLKLILVGITLSLIVIIITIYLTFAYKRRKKTNPVFELQNILRGQSKFEHISKKTFCDEVEKLQKFHVKQITKVKHIGNIFFFQWAKAKPKFSFHLYFEWSP